MKGVPHYTKAGKEWKGKRCLMVSCTQTSPIPKQVNACFTSKI